MKAGDVRKLENPEYVPIANIGRCLHLPDARKCNKKSKIFAHKINSKVADVEAKVAWFEPSKSMDEHNFYGNVTYQIEYRKAFGKLGPNLYYIDQGKSPTHIYSRVLLTSKNHNLPMVASHDRNFPVLLYGGRIYGAASCGSGHAVLEHVLEIGIELTAETSRWLFQNCEIKYNNHSLANSRNPGRTSYKKHICHRHNTFGRKCPFSYTKEEAQFEMADPATLFTEQYSHSVQTECAVIEEYNDSDEFEVDYDNYDSQTVEVHRDATKSSEYGDGSSAYGGSSSAYDSSSSSAYGGSSSAYDSSSSAYDSSGSAFDSSSSASGGSNSAYDGSKSAYGGSSSAYGGSSSAYGGSSSAYGGSSSAYMGRSDAYGDGIDSRSFSSSGPSYSSSFQSHNRQPSKTENDDEWSERTKFAIGVATVIGAGLFVLFGKK